MVGHIWLETGFGGHMERKSQEVSATYMKLLGSDRRWKKVRVKLTPPPMRDRVKNLKKVNNIKNMKYVKKMDPQYLPHVYSSDNKQYHQYSLPLSS